MKFFIAILSLALTLGLLSSCKSSPSKHYFLLNTPANLLNTPARASAEANSQIAPGNITRSIGIGPIVIADYLNRLAIVRTQDDNSLQISDSDYWGEPLDKGITRVLADSLRQRNPSISFIQFPYRSDSRPSHSLRVQIHNLNYNGNQASINATWELIDTTTKQTITRKNFTQTTPAAAGPNDIAKAYSGLLVKLVEDVQGDLVRL